MHFHFSANTRRWFAVISPLHRVPALRGSAFRSIGDVPFHHQPVKGVNSRNKFKYTREPKLIKIRGTKRHLHTHSNNNHISTSNTWYISHFYTLPDKRQFLWRWGAAVIYHFHLISEQGFISQVSTSHKYRWKLFKCKWNVDEGRGSWNVKTTHADTPERKIPCKCKGSPAKWMDAQRTGWTSTGQNETKNMYINIHLRSDVDVDVMLIENVRKKQSLLNNFHIVYGNWNAVNGGKVYENRNKR